MSLTNWRQIIAPCKALEKLNIIVSLCSMWVRNEHHLQHPGAYCVQIVWQNLMSSSLFERFWKEPQSGLFIYLLQAVLEHDMNINGTLVFQMPRELQNLRSGNRIIHRWFLTELKTDSDKAPTGIPKQIHQAQFQVKYSDLEESTQSIHGLKRMMHWHQFILVVRVCSFYWQHHDLGQTCINRTSHCACDMTQQPSVNQST